MSEPTRSEQIAAQAEMKKALTRQIETLEATCALLQKQIADLKEELERQSPYIKSSKTYYDWTENDESLVLELERDGYPIVEIASRIGRSPRAVKNKLTLLKSRKSRAHSDKPAPWSDEEKALAIEMFTNGDSIEKIDSKIGRGEDAVYKFLHRNGYTIKGRIL